MLSFCSLYYGESNIPTIKSKISILNNSTPKPFTNWKGSNNNKFNIINKNTTKFSTGSDILQTYTSQANKESSVSKLVKNIEQQIADSKLSSTSSFSSSDNIAPVPMPRSVKNNYAEKSTENSSCSPSLNPRQRNDQFKRGGRLRSSKTKIRNDEKTIRNDQRKDSPPVVNCDTPISKSKTKEDERVGYKNKESEDLSSHTLQNETKSNSVELQQQPPQIISENNNILRKSMISNNNFLIANTRTRGATLKIDIKKPLSGGFGLTIASRVTTHHASDHYLQNNKSDGNEETNSTSEVSGASSLFIRMINPGSAGERAGFLAGDR